MIIMHFLMLGLAVRQQDDEPPVYDAEGVALFQELHN